MKPIPPSERPRAPGTPASAVDLARAIDASDQAVLVVDANGIVLFANARAEAWFSTQAPLTGNLSPVAWKREGAGMVDMAAADGTTLHLQRSVAAISWADAPAQLVSLQDVTARHSAEMHLRRLGRLHAALGQTAAALARAKHEQDLLEDACRIGVALAGFRAVWIGRANAEHTEIVRLAAAGAAVLAGDRLVLDPDEPAGHGPVAQTLRLGVPYICNLVAADSRLGFWEATARQLDIASLAVCPLYSGGAVNAVMAFYARESGCFDRELVSVITQISGEVSGALERLASREQRRRVENALGEAESRFRLIAGASRQVLWMRDAVDGRLLYASPAFTRIFGCPPDGFLESTGAWVPLVHPDDRARFAAQPVGTASVTLRYRIIRPDGAVRWIEDEIVPVEEHGRVRYFTGSAADITHRHEAVRQLSLFRSLVDSACDAFYILQPAEDFRLTYINEAGVRHFGWSREELAAMRPWDWDPNFTRETTLAAWEMLKARGSALYETTTRRKDGSLARVEVVSSYLRHDDEEFNVGYFRDISARARAEEDLRGSEERFRAVFEEASDALIIVDPAVHRFIDCNENAVRLFEAADKAHLLETNDPDLLASRLPDAEIEARRERIRTEGTWSGLLEYRSIRGRRFWGAAVVRRIEVGGRPLNILRITDTTENRRLVELLAETESLARIGGWEYHVDERRLVWTNGSYLIHGVPPGTTITAEEALALHDPQFRPAIEAAVQEGMRIGQPWSIESCLTQGGRETWVRITGNTELADGQARRIHGTIEDITERKRREAGLLRAQRLESIGTLAGGIAHDLNNILAPVVLSSDMLRLRLRDAADLELVQAIGASARRGAEIVRQVLSFARGVEGTHVPMNIRHLLPEIRNIVSETFPRTITCRTESPHDLWSVMGEPTQLHQVLLNLCLNAHDAMPDGGTLTLRAANIEVDAALATATPDARTGPHVRIQISDTGCGIAPELRERIFEPFFTTKQPGRGSGLGLSTAIAIVRSHHGFITLDSEPGRGTTIAVHLPADQPPSAPARVPSAVASEISGRGRTILVIDDEASVRSITRQSLESAGFRVLAAEDGARGIALFMQYREQISLVLTDLMMPVMDGVAVIKALRRIAPTAPVIAMSGATDATGLAASLSPSPGVGFLLKPFNLDSLLHVVRDAIGTPHAP